MKDSRARLEAYLRHRLACSDFELADDSSGAILLRELARSLLGSGDQGSWVRRPSISDDGWPIILSLKAGHGRDQAIRVLVESGSLQMTVAEQIAYSLTRLDELLGLLGWRSASEGINSITKQVFPLDSSATVRWRGGMWLGAEVEPNSSQPELRLYINLRRGEAAARWKRLCGLITSFASETIDAFLRDWSHRASKHALPVGLGVVLKGGRLPGIRAYLGVETPSAESLAALCSDIPMGCQGALQLACDTFNSRFGPIRRQGVTMGYDFVPCGEGARRVKADICCHLVAPDLRPRLVPWIEELFGEWGYEYGHLREFLAGIHAFWLASEVQFLSLGFAPELEHATVYVKPTD